jgi:acyl-CoA thioesterase-2
VPWDVPQHGAPSRYQGWVRSRTPLPDGPGFRAAALAFLSDVHSHFPVARRLGGSFEPVGYTSLDQTLWIHRDLAWDDWWLATSESDVAHAGRALTRRSLHTRDGRLVATMVQEQLIPATR